MGQVIGLIISLAAFFTGVWMLKNIIRKKLKCVNRVQATITGFIEKERRNDDFTETVYYYSYQYSINNNIYTGTTNVAGRSCSYKAGDKIDVKYNPGNPSQHYPEGIDYAFAMIMGGIVFIVLGGGISMVIISFF